MSHPVFAQEDATHIGVVQKFDAVEVINFTFVEIGNLPKVTHSVEIRFFLVLCHRFDVLHFKGITFRKAVNHTHSFFSPVHTGEIFEEGVAFFLEFCQGAVQFFSVHHFCFHLIFRRCSRFRRRTWCCRCSRFWCFCLRSFSLGCFRSRCSLFSRSSLFGTNFCLGCFRSRCSLFDTNFYHLSCFFSRSSQFCSFLCLGSFHSRSSSFRSALSNFRSGIFRLRRQLFFFFHYASSCSLSSSLYSCCISFL